MLFAGTVSSTNATIKLECTSSKRGGIFEYFNARDYTTRPTGFSI
jgi:hypothetical protein